MKAPTSRSKITSGPAALRSLCMLWLCLFGGAQALAQTGMPGRVLSSTGATAGGLIGFNTNGSNVVHLSANAFDTTCTDEPQHKSTHPSATRDGRLIAFSSTRDRTGAVGGGFGGSLRVFVMNADGTGGLRQVTFPQTDNNGSGGVTAGSILSVAWSPDGTRLAFKGTRLAADNSTNSPNFHHVIGLINPDGTGEATLAVVDSTGIVPTLDWSPDGRYIATTRGREAQGAAPFRVILFDLQTNTSREILPEGNQGNWQARLEQNKQEFAAAFVLRPRFLAA